MVATKPMLPRFEYAVEMHSPPDEVWREFATINRLHRETRVERDR